MPNMPQLLLFIALYLLVEIEATVPGSIGCIPNRLKEKGVGFFGSAKRPVTKLPGK